MLAKADYERRLFMAARTDSARQRRILEREFLIKTMEPDNAEGIRVHRLEALQLLLQERGCDVEELRLRIEIGEDIAPTPVRTTPIRPQAPRNGWSRNSSQKGLEQFQIHGQGIAVTPSEEAGEWQKLYEATNLELATAKLEAREERRRADEAERRAQEAENEARSPRGSGSAGNSAGGSPREVAGSTADVLAEAIGKAMAQAMQSSTQSSIQVCPKVEWPTLGDDDDGRGIGIFQRV